MIIEGIKSPDDLKKIARDKLPELAEEIRQLIIRQVSVGGGHLSSNLGVVDLTIALHYVFDAPKDKIIWDVGHQSYAHKLLTGRFGIFHTLRQHNGLSGFPKMDEGPYDAFGTGHSSTSISAALGIIEARDITKNSGLISPDYSLTNKVIAVIGDGAMTSGLAFEGLNHAGQLKKDLIVILNDNEMSISKNVGALSAYLNRILTAETFQKIKKEMKTLIENIPKVGSPMSKMAHKAEERLKGLFLPGILFEELGFNYIGPIDGHDIEFLIDTLKRVRSSEEPVLLHLVTRKGKGYKFSEEDPCVYHGIGPFEVETGLLKTTEVVQTPLREDYSKKSGTTWTDIFGEVIVELASYDRRVTAVTAAMKEGTGLSLFAEKYPERFYDVGIAEPHAVTFAAGLASQGVRPFVCIYSTFLQRAYDEIIHDVCLQRLPVVFAIDRAGIVGEDGATHQGLFDIAFLRHIPDLVLMAPRDAEELGMMLRLSLRHNGPSAIRYPRGRIPQNGDSGVRNAELKIGEAEVLIEGDDITIIALGNTVSAALKAAKMLAGDGIRACVVNARFIKPLDKAMILSLAGVTGRIVTVEEGVIAGGFGSAVLECLNNAGMTDVVVSMVGIGDEFVEHGPQSFLRKKHRLDEAGISSACRTLFASHPSHL